jgi:hypothetical protein
MDCNQVAACKVRGSTCPLIDLQRSDIAPVRPKHPAIRFLDRSFICLLGNLADPLNKSTRLFVRPVQFEAQIVRRIAVLIAAGRF